MNRIPFNRPHFTDRYPDPILQVLESRLCAGDGPFTGRCHEWLEMQTGCHKALLTQSCTAALEMMALLLELEPGDEVIMPSFTFTSTANAFALRGAVCVFVDIRPDTLNIDERLVTAAITKKTKAICVVHYAGIACEMDTIMQIAKAYGLAVVEDAAQGIMSTYKGRPLGSIGRMGSYSFHESKNVVCGEGGVLLLQHSEDAQRAEIIREKGTNRSAFFRGEVDKYTWRDIGSSYLPSELVAALLWSQLRDAQIITTRRLAAWNYYHHLLSGTEGIQLPFVPPECQHNGHIFYVILPSQELRDATLRAMRAADIWAVTHYVPLHSAPAGLRTARCGSQMTHTNDLPNRLLRLPLFSEISQKQQLSVTETLQLVMAGHLSPK